MRCDTQRLLRDRTVCSRVALVAIIAIFAAAGAVAESPNAIYMSKQMEPSQEVPLGTDHPVPEGFSAPTVVSAAEFRSDGFDMEDFFFSFYGGGYLEGGSGGNHCFMAPVYLPVGATVTELYFSGIDNDADLTFGVNLNRVDNYTGVVDSMASAVSEGASTSARSFWDSSIVEPVVTKYLHSYYLTSCLANGNHQLYNVRIYWTK